MERGRKGGVRDIGEERAGSGMGDRSAGLKSRDGHSGSFSKSWTHEFCSYLKSVAGFGFFTFNLDGIGNTSGLLRRGATDHPHIKHVIYGQ